MKQKLVWQKTGVDLIYDLDDSEFTTLKMAHDTTTMNNTSVASTLISIYTDMQHMCPDNICSQNQNMLQVSLHSKEKAGFINQGFFSNCWLAYSSYLDNCGW